MKAKMAAGLSVLMVLFCLSVVYAEPDKTVSYLMEEPVTALDFGLFQLEQQLAAIADDDFIWISRADYNWEANRFDLIFVTRHMPAIKTKAEMRRRCLAFVTRIRDRIRPADLKKAFSHRGFTKPTAPPDIGGHLANLTRVAVHGYYETGKKLVCRGALSGTGINCGE